MIIMRSHLICFFIALVLITAGCAEKENPLVFAVGGAPNEVDYWEQLVKEFEQKTGIPTSLRRHPTDTDQRRQSLVISLEASKADPDIFLMDVAWVAQFAASDWLTVLEPSIQQDAFDTTALFDPVVEQVDRYKNQIIALPVYVDCGLLYYRKDLLEQENFSAPETWDELIEQATSIQETHREQNKQFYGIVWQGAQYEGLVCNFVEFITAYGGEIFTVEGDLVLSSEANVKGLELMKALIHDYKISPPNTFTEMKEEETRTFFQNGNALFERNWPYAWQLHQTENSPVKDKVAIGLLPRTEEGRHGAALGGWHIGISKYTDQPDKAWELVKYILSYETQKRICLDLGWNPGRKDVYDDPEVKDEMPHMEILARALEHSVARPTIPAYTQISEIIQKYVNEAIAGKEDCATALNKAEKEITSILEIYHE